VEAAEEAAAEAAAEEAAEAEAAEAAAEEAAARAQAVWAAAVAAAAPAAAVEPKRDRESSRARCMWAVCSWVRRPSRVALHGLRSNSSRMRRRGDALMACDGACCLAWESGSHERSGGGSQPLQ